MMHAHDVRRRLQLCRAANAYRSNGRKNGRRRAKVLCARLSMIAAARREFNAAASHYYLSLGNIPRSLWEAD